MKNITISINNEEYKRIQAIAGESSIYSLLKQAFKNILNTNYPTTIPVPITNTTPTTTTSTPKTKTPPIETTENIKKFCNNCIGIYPFINGKCSRCKK